MLTRRPSGSNRFSRDSIIIIIVVIIIIIIIIIINLSSLHGKKAQGIWMQGSTYLQPRHYGKIGWLALDLAVFTPGK